MMELTEIFKIFKSKIYAVGTSNKARSVIEQYRLCYLEAAYLMASCFDL